MLFALTLLCSTAGIGALSPCPGESRGSVCNFNDADGYEYRVCQQVVGPAGEPLAIYEGQSWWGLSGQADRAASMTSKIQASGGNSWCTCALCTSEVIAKVGCDSVPISCEATDLEWVRATTDGRYEALKGCLASKCTAPPQQLSDASLEDPVPHGSLQTFSWPVLNWSSALVAAVMMMALLALFTKRWIASLARGGRYTDDVASSDDLS
mmetsp:Transcript_8827/g.18250  ORF Transcript_8827/g.18250 Transcript_8827/m.18250 type:complete len:210 (-) Transcript_8827:104-733(-)